MELNELIANAFYQSATSGTIQSGTDWKQDISDSAEFSKANSDIFPKPFEAELVRVIKDWNDDWTDASSMTENEIAYRNYYHDYLYSNDKQSLYFNPIESKIFAMESSPRQFLDFDAIGIKEVHSFDNRSSKPDYIDIADFSKLVEVRWPRIYKLAF